MNLLRNKKRRKIENDGPFLNLPIDARRTISNFLNPKDSIMVGTTNQSERQEYLKSQLMHCDAEAKSGCEYCTLANNSRRQCQAKCLKSEQQCKRNSVSGPVPMCRQHMKMVGLDTTLESKIPQYDHIEAIVFKHDMNEVDMKEAKLTVSQSWYRDLPEHTITLTLKKPKHILFKYRQPNGKTCVTFTTIKLIDYSQLQHIDLKFQCCLINEQHIPLRFNIQKKRAIGLTSVPNGYQWQYGPQCTFRGLMGLPNEYELTRHARLGTKLAFLITKLVHQAFRLQSRRIMYDWNHIWLLVNRYQQIQNMKVISQFT